MCFPKPVVTLDSRKSKILGSHPMPFLDRGNYLQRQGCVLGSKLIHSHDDSDNDFRPSWKTRMETMINQVTSWPKQFMHTSWFNSSSFQTERPCQYPEDLLEVTGPFYLFLFLSWPLLNNSHLSSFYHHLLGWYMRTHDQDLFTGPPRQGFCSESSSYMTCADQRPTGVFLDGWLFPLYTDCSVVFLQS